MEKLIELLNEYEKLNMGRWFVYYCERDDTIENANEFIKVSEVISKKYGFIKWLVDNNKIDLDACEGEKTYNNLTASRDSNYTQYERLLMSLSIQDNPIEFLVSILK